ncbi:MAG: DsrE/DsrF/DrsH-like family protein, partial [Austwickia sp.]|nr:DsrE/DsrF/DrsH-like family protein [Austwickia sp.]
MTTITETVQQSVPEAATEQPAGRKLVIICSKGNLDMAYPALIMGNAALGEGIETHFFFTFWGMDIISKSKIDHLKVVPVGNPAMHMPQLVGGLPGMTDLATTMMKREIEKLDMPPVHEFLEMIHDAGAGIFACRMAADMMHLDEDD